MLNSKNQMENIDLQMGMNMKAWQNLYNFAHEYSGWINYLSSKGILGCGCNKYRHSWRHGWKHPEMLMIKELYHSYWQFNCQICLFYVYCTSKLDYYIFNAPVLPVSNRLTIEQGVSEYILIFLLLVEHTFTSFST